MRPLSGLVWDWWPCTNLVQSENCGAVWFRVLSSDRYHSQIGWGCTASGGRPNGGCWWRRPRGRRRTGRNRNRWGIWSAAPWSCPWCRNHSSHLPTPRRKGENGSAAGCQGPAESAEGLPTFMARHGWWVMAAAVRGSSDQVLAGEVKVRRGARAVGGWRVSSASRNCARIAKQTRTHTHTHTQTLTLTHTTGHQSNRFNTRDAAELTATGWRRRTGPTYPSYTGPAPCCDVVDDFGFFLFVACFFLSRSGSGAGRLALARPHRHTHTYTHTHTHTVSLGGILFFCALFFILSLLLLLGHPSFRPLYCYGQPMAVVNQVKSSGAPSQHYSAKKRNGIDT